MSAGGLERSTTGEAAFYYFIFRPIDLYYRDNRRFQGKNAVEKEKFIRLMHGYVATVKEHLGLQASTGLWRYEKDRVLC